MKTFRELLKEGTGRLTAAGVDNAAFDARQLMQEAFGLSGAELLSELGSVPAETAEGSASESRFRELIERRALREPLQHILGRTCFMGFDIGVNRDVLVPRRETETLCELILDREKNRNISVLDLCTGSGCIAIALKLLGRYESVTASDISEAALKKAAENAAMNNADICFVYSDLFEAFEAESGGTEAAASGGRFDFIVSNPPYIKSEVIGTLEPEVKAFDPVGALDGGADGLHFYRLIAAEAVKQLKEGGRLYLETGYDQGEAVKGLLLSEGYKAAEIHKDLSGADRIVLAHI